MSLWQLGRTIQHQHRSGLFQIGNRLTRSLYKQNIARTKADQVEIASHLRARSARPVQRQRQQAVADAETRRSEAAQVKRRAACHDHFRELLAFRLERCFFIDRVFAV